MILVYSLLSLVLTCLISFVCITTSGFWLKDAIYMLLEIVHVNNFFAIKLILLAYIIAFFCIFGIMVLLAFKKKVEFLCSSLMSSGIVVLIFSWFFSSFNVVKNFYFVSNDFSNIVRIALKKFFFTNILLGSIILIISSSFIFVKFFVGRKEYEEE